MARGPARGAIAIASVATLWPLEEGVRRARGRTEIRRSADLAVPVSCHCEDVVTALASRAVVWPAASFGCSLGCRASVMWR